MFSTPSQFAKVGSRDYIQGSMIVDQMVSLVCSGAVGIEFSSVSIASAKFNFKTLCDGELVVSFDSDDQLELGKPCADFAGALLPNGPSFRGVFVPDERKAVSARRANDDLDIASLEVSGRASGSCWASWGDRSGLLKVLVEVNKRVVASAFPEVGNRIGVDLVYLQDLTFPLTNTCTNRLVSSRNLSERLIDGDFYFVNEICWGSDSFEQARFLFHVYARG